jgi:hypothetical protein
MPNEGLSLYPEDSILQNCEESFSPDCKIATMLFFLKWIPLFSSHYVCHFNSAETPSLPAEWDHALLGRA